MTTSSGSPSLTVELRDLVWGLESEVAQITRLCRRIDQHVREVNALRLEAAERLLLLDDLVDSAPVDPHLRAWLATATDAALPAVTEHFPDRLYTD